MARVGLRAPRGVRAVVLGAAVAWASTSPAAAARYMKSGCMVRWARKRKP